MSIERPRGEDATLAATTPSEATPTSEPDAPARLGGRYELIGLLGVGGMGSVYRARDLELGEVVALKMLRRELVGTIEALERFRQEVRLARRVTHPNVARTFDIGEHAGERFLTMELVDGGSLARRITEKGAQPLDEVVRIGAAIADGLAAAHAVGVVHRDLKPDNVLLGRDGRVVITDFGIARASDGAGRTGIGQAIGTPAYMAPEQVEAKAVDARADLYALGLVLYELLTGERAWPGDAMFAVAAARLVSPPPDPSAKRAIPDALARVVRACMAREPSARPESASRVAADLRAIESKPSTTSLPQPRFDRTIDRTLIVASLRDAGIAEDRWIAEGLADDLTDALSMVPGLRVRARSVGAAGAADPRELGRRADVDVVVDGSVRRSGDVLRINLRLLSVRDGFQLWARRFDGRIGDLLTMNDDAARAITEALTDALGANAARSRAAAADAEAIELYLRARPGLSSMLDATYDEAERLLDRALDLAPEHPVILSERSLSRIARTFLVGQPTLLLARAEDEARRALAHAPDLGEPWVALAHVFNNSGRPAEAVTALRRAIRNAPSLARAHDLLGRILLESAHYDAALHHLERAIWLDPVVLAFPFVDVARLHALRGDVARMREAHARLRVRSPTHHRLNSGRMSLWFGEVLETDPWPPDEFERSVRVCEIQRRALVDRRLDARDLATIDGWAANDHYGPRARRLFMQIRGEVAAGIGDHERVKQSVQGAIDAGLVDLAWMDACPMFTAYRREAWWHPLLAIVQARVLPIIDAYTGAVPP